MILNSREAGAKAQNLQHPVEIFYSYAHKDEEFRAELEKHLSLMRRNGEIAGWHDRNISAGTDWKDSIDKHLESAQLILLLVSADFLASDYCYEVEMMRALERQKEGTARVIPIILRNCDWSSAPFSRLQALPENAKPIKSWGDQDEAYQDVVAGIREAVAQITGAPRVRQARVEILAGGLTRRQTASLTLIGTLIMLGVFLGLMLRSSTTLQTANAPSTPAATTPESRNSPETLMLSGFVVDSKDRAVQGAKVTINEMPTMEPVETTSDGRFIINGVPKQYGQWVRIRVVKEGYFPNPYEENYLLGSTPTTIQLRRAK